MTPRENKITKHKIKGGKAAKQALCRRLDVQRLPLGYFSNKKRKSKG